MTSKLSPALARVLFVCLCALTAGCGLLPSETDKDKEMSRWPEDRLYQAAKDHLDGGTCGSAIEYYEKLQSRYPFGVYTQQAQLELAARRMAGELQTIRLVLEALLRAAAARQCHGRARDR